MNPQPLDTSEFVVVVAVMTMCAGVWVGTLLWVTGWARRFGRRVTGCSCEHLGDRRES